MAAIVTCAHCGGAVRLPERMLGDNMKVACPHCRKPLGKARELCPATEAPPSAPPPPSRTQVAAPPPKSSSSITSKPPPQSKPASAPPPVRKRERPTPPPEQPLMAEVVPDDEVPARSIEDYEVEDAIADTGYEVVADDKKPSPVSPWADDDDDDEVEGAGMPPRARRPRRQRIPGNYYIWDKVRLGFRLICIATIIILVLSALNLVIGLIGWAVASVSQGPPSPVVVGGGVGIGYVFLVLEQIALWISFALYIVGLVFCLFAPYDHGAKAFAIATLALIGFGCSMPLFGYFFVSVPVASPFEPSPGFAFAALGPLMWLGGLGLFVSIFTFLLLERSIGVCLRDKDLVRLVHIVLIMIGAAIVLVIIMQGVVFGATAHSIAESATTGRPSFGSALTSWKIFFCVYIITSLIVGIAYIVPIFKTHTIVVDHVNRC
jgi:hypothetical protein